MGSCLSTQYYNSGSAIKQQHLSSIGSSSIQEHHNHVLSTTPVTENLKSQPSQSPNSNPSQDMGYKDEIFYDSQQYIDSDCEDYLSINGDFSTPGHGHGHENGFAETVGMDEDKNQISPECEAPIEKKKKLAQLFEDGSSDHHVDVIESKTGESTVNKFESDHHGDVIESKTGEATVNKFERLKLVRSFSSCLPRKVKSPCLQQQLLSHHY